MEAIIKVHKDGKYFVAVDMYSGVADQGRTREEAVANLKKGLKERYETIREITSRSPNTVRLDIGVGHAKTAASVS